MRVARIVTIALLGSPLVACSGSILPPKPLPDWAMSRQAEPQARTKTRNAAIRKTPENSATVSHVPSAKTQADDVLPFTPAWQAREDEFDSKLRRTMNICNGC